MFLVKTKCTINLYCLNPRNPNNKVQIIDEKKYNCYTELSFTPQYKISESEEIK